MVQLDPENNDNYCKYTSINISGIDTQLASDLHYQRLNVASINETEFVLLQCKLCTFIFGTSTCALGDEVGDVKCFTCYGL